MAHLLLKISRLGSKRKVIAWITNRIGAYSVGVSGFRMTASEHGEFSFAIDHEKPETVGAGGQYTYKVYELVEEPHGAYALVRPTIKSVRDQYPHACRLVNMRNGHESALCDNEEQGRATLRNAIAGRLKGGFN